MRAVGDPAARFREDYLRILRAIRFAARFGFAIDPATWQAAREAGARPRPPLGRAGAGRVVQGPAHGQDLETLVRLWHESGAAAAWLPGAAVPVPRAVPSPELSPPPRDPVLLTRAPARAIRRRAAPAPGLQRGDRAGGGDGGGAAAARRAPARSRCDAGSPPSATRRTISPRCTGCVGRRRPLARGRRHAIRERRDPAHARRPGGDRARPGGARPPAAEPWARRSRRCSTGCWRIRRPTPASACSRWRGSGDEPRSWFALAAALGNMAGRARGGAESPARAPGHRRLPRVRRGVHARRGGARRAAGGAARRDEGEALYVLVGYLAVHLAQHVLTPALPLRRGDPPGEPVRRRLGAAGPHAAHLLRRRRDRERLPGLGRARRAALPRRAAAQAARGGHHRQRHGGRRPESRARRWAPRRCWGWRRFSASS